MEVYKIGKRYTVNRPGDRHHGKTGQMYRIIPNIDLVKNGHDFHKYWLKFDDMPDGALGYGFEADELEEVNG